MTRWLVALVALTVTAPAMASTASGHGDPLAPLLLWLAVLLVAAKLGGDLATRIGQPAVLGELVVGVVLGNLELVGLGQLGWLAHDPRLDLLARLGVLLLLFEVGLESTVRQMLEVGASSVLVAVLGVIAPFALGWGVGVWLLPGASSYAHAFPGATLTATSVGITARVLQDLGRSQSGEARIILGAAVVDDVLGLIILAVLSGAITAADRGTGMSWWSVLAITGKAAAFLVGALVVGTRLSPRIFTWAENLRARGVLLALGLGFCFFLSWLADRIGLAPIVGAFAAGLVLERAHWRGFEDRGEHSLEELLQPISSFLVPLFFVVMGLRTDLRAFVQPGVAGLAAALTVAAILGKQLCSAGVVTRGVDRLSVGLGMIPRGEVGLIFANLGMSLTVHGERIISESTFAATVVMVIVTTLVTPPAVKWSLRRAGGERAIATGATPH